MANSTSSTERRHVPFPNQPRNVLEETPSNIDRVSFKELIKYKGLQVAPAELEGFIATHAAVADVAVIGINYRDTEAPRAYVVRAPSPAGKKLTEADVAKFVADNMAAHKQLRGGVKFVDAVPRSPAGKILRKELREWRKRDERESKL
jgi:4-coumarate--CoA ligase